MNPTIKIPERSTRTKAPKKLIRKALVDNPYLIIRELCHRNFSYFVKYFWSEYSTEKLEWNWHMEYICKELQLVAENLAEGKPKIHDLLINVPPGTTKTTLVTIMFNDWCWCKWYWMEFICWSHADKLTLENAEQARDILLSDKFQTIFPEIGLKADKGGLGNYRVVKKVFNTGRVQRQLNGGNRLSTSIEGAGIGFHAHFLIFDDPCNPKQSYSSTQLSEINKLIDSLLSTRKISKTRSVVIMVMQRLAEGDPSEHWLKKSGKNIKHICLPGEIFNYRDQVKPAGLIRYYKDGLLDPVRLTKENLEELEVGLGTYGYSGQVGQTPVSPQGGMFKVNMATIIKEMPSPSRIERIVRYWDKAGTKEPLQKSKHVCYTVGTKIALLSGIPKTYVIMDVIRGRWSSDEREDVIYNTAVMDGPEVYIYHEQEPGSGGKQSAEQTNEMLTDFMVESDLPVGDKIFRADPLSACWNKGRVMLLEGAWNSEYLHEFKFFPLSTYKDQVDSTSGGYQKLSMMRMAEV